MFLKYHFLLVVVENLVSMMEIGNATSFDRDEEGYLVDPNSWDENFARLIALEENIVLVDDHWITLQYIRDHFNEKHTAPDVRHVFKHLAVEKGWDKRAAKKRLFELFPYGYVKQACKIAGMKRPRAWSTG